jgi:hypothetical protein
MLWNNYQGTYIIFHKDIVSIYINIYKQDENRHVRKKNALEKINKFQLLMKPQDVYLMLVPNLSIALIITYVGKKRITRIMQTLMVL